MLQKIAVFLCCIYGSSAVDGNWSQWGSWGSCSQTCGSGSRYRSRSCSDPFPSFNGAPCAGNSQETQTCNANTCPPINGAWSNWGDWGACDNPCGSGSKTRTRDCTNPAPAYGGSQCSGTNLETQTEICTGPCAVNGAWSNWGSYGTCTHTCGGGKRARGRTCTNPVPSNGGDDCPGYAYDVGDCNTGACTVPASGTYVQLCPTNFFTCESGTVGCIDETKKCDCTNHCSDGSDETENYASCTAPHVCSSAFGFNTRSSVLLFVLLTAIQQIYHRVF